MAATPKRPRGRPRKNPPPPPEPSRRPPTIDKDDGESDGPELDAMDDAVHEARGDGHFAPATRRFEPDETDHDCPDEPPPGWEGE